MVNNAQLCADRLAIPDGGGLAAVNSPISHEWVLSRGARGVDRRAKIVLMPMFDPGLFLELIESERAVVSRAAFPR